MKETSIQPRPAAASVDLAGHIALVTTGAASGIGRACAERLARAGAAVTVLDLSGGTAKDVAEKIGSEAM
jgi:3-hydroxybutyrate dehydrogenase